MTPDDIDWPPPICDACRDGQCRDCVLSSGCEHLECGWLYGEHEYLSTACHHELHERCRRTCKFCRTACRCHCHREAL